MNTERRMSGRSSRSRVGPVKRNSPFSMNTARSARLRATLTDCSTTMMVVPRRWISSTTSRSRATMVGARPSESSSIMSSSGRVMSAPPRASICCSPPERSPASWPDRSPRIGNRSRTSARAAFTRWGSSRMSQVARRRFSATVRVGKMPLPPGISAAPLWVTRSADRPVMSSPLKVTVPALGAFSPQIALSRVDLPAPLVPRRATTSPRFTSRSTPKRIWTGP